MKSKGGGRLAFVRIPIKTVAVHSIWAEKSKILTLKCYPNHSNHIYHTLYPGCNIFVYIADQKQPNTSRARMDCGKLTLFLLLQTLKRGVASQDFAEKHSVPTFMFRHK